MLGLPVATHTERAPCQCVEQMSGDETESDRGEELVHRRGEDVAEGAGRRSDRFDLPDGMLGPVPAGIAHVDAGAVETDDEGTAAVGSEDHVGHAEVIDRAATPEMASQ